MNRLQSRSIAVRMLVMAILAIFIVGAVPAVSFAQDQMQVHKKKNFAQRHPTLTSAAAGYAAYKVAKTTGKNRAMHGKKKNFAQRHPFLTGMAAAGATHHVIKKTDHNN